LGGIKKYTSVTFIDNWFDGISFSDFKHRLPKEVPWFIFHPKIFMWTLKSDAMKMNDNFNALALQLHQEMNP